MGAAVGMESLLPTLGAQQREEKEENRPLSSSHLTLIVRMMAASGWRDASGLSRGVGSMGSSEHVQS